MMGGNKDKTKIQYQTDNNKQKSQYINKQIIYYKNGEKGRKWGETRKNSH